MAKKCGLLARYARFAVKQLNFLGKRSEFPTQSDLPVEIPLAELTEILIRPSAYEESHEHTSTPLSWQLAYRPFTHPSGRPHTRGAATSPTHHR